MEKKVGRLSFKIVILLLALSISAYSAYIFLSQRYTYDVVYPSSSFTELRHLSDYNPMLKGTFYDSPVFVFDSGVEGENVMILGGTHPNEVAGVLSSYFAIENAVVESGKLIVVPVINFSGQSATESGKASYPYYHVGDREFKAGSRIMSPLDSWPDPPIFVQLPSKVHLGSDEARNVNRSYPGMSPVPVSEVAKGVMSILKEEEIDMAYDLHEASVTYPVNRVIISNQDGLDAAFLAAMMMEGEGLTISTEASQPGNTGYSHHEWGEVDGVIPFLIEVPSPTVDRIQGPLTERLILDGKDEFLVKVNELGFAFGNYSEDGISLDKRVALHVDAILNTFLAAEALMIKDHIGITLPTGPDILSNGLDFYFEKAISDNPIKVR